MSTYSQGHRRARLVRRSRNRKGLQMQRADGLYDTDALSRTIINSPGDKTSHSLSQSIQAKLSVGSSDDVYEREADRTADKVVNAAEPATSSASLQKMEEEEAQTKPLLQRQEEEEEAQAKPLLQRQEEEEEAQAKPLLQRQEEEEEELQAKLLLQRQEEEEEELQAKPLLQRQEEAEEEEEEVQPKLQKKESSASNTVASNTSDKITSRKGSGIPMGSQTRHFMESQFRRDLSTVRIHNDHEANDISQQLRSQAFTLGKDIYFNVGKYNPETRQGKHLLAHELTHVVQQNHSLKKKSSPEAQKKPDPKKLIKKDKELNGKLVFKISGLKSKTKTRSVLTEKAKDKIPVPYPKKGAQSMLKEKNRKVKFTIKN
jgi:hypothetical protein